jgi:photosystem II stability/assembly factor-like uncharacterized protein
MPVVSLSARRPAHSLAPGFVLSLALFALSAPAPFAQSWTTLTSGSTANLGAVHFPTRNTGYATGINNVPGNILKTTNGGSSWAPTTNMDWTYLGIHFISADTGWLVGNGGDIRKTTNGGTSWINQTNTGGGTTLLSSVHFVNANVGYAGVQSNTGTVIKTTNGGTSWTPQVTGSGATILGVHFLNADTGFAVGSGGIRRTTNGGTAWTSVSTTNLRTLAFASPLVGYAVGDLGTILKSTNGGANWTSQFGGISAPAAITGNTFHAVSCVGPARCYAAGSTTGGVWRIFRTVDGGASWAATDSGTGAGFSGKVGIHFPDSTAGYLVAQGGQIRKSGAVPASLASAQAGLSANLRLARTADGWTLAYTLAAGDMVTASLRDARGRSVWSATAHGQAGENNLSIPASRAAAGLYVLEFRAGETRQYLKLGVVSSSF